MLSVRRMKVLTALALQAGLTALGCDSITGVELTVAHPSHLDQLLISGAFEDGAAFDPVSVSRQPESPPRTIAGTVVVLLPDARDGEMLSLQIDGTAAGVSLIATAEIEVVRGELARAEVLVAGCGDGLLSDGESCDDANSIGGDDCSEECTPPKDEDPPQPIELPFGELIDELAIAASGPSSCGDGALDGLETCDDQNAIDGDGCARCRIEERFICLFQPSVCYAEDQVAIADGTMVTINDALGTGRQVILVKAGTHQTNVNIEGDRTVVGEPGSIVETNSAVWLNEGRISIRGLTIRSTADGVDVDGTNTIVELREVTIESDYRGVVVDPGGSVAILGCTIVGHGTGVYAAGSSSSVTIAESTIGPSDGLGIAIVDGAPADILRNLIKGNASGGVRLNTSGAWTLANNFVVENGDQNSDLGGVEIARISTSPLFVNNTVSANQAYSVAGGIQCGPASLIVNSIVWANDGEMSPQCVSQHSLVGVDPIFRSQGDYHLDSGSPAIDQADPAGVAPAGPAPAIDVDGDVRPAGGRVDVGADERVDS